MKSIIITSESNILLIAQNINNAIIKANNEYDVHEEGAFISILWRNWLPESEYQKLVAPINRTEIIDDVLREQSNLNLDTQSKLDKIMRFMKLNPNTTYIDKFPTFDSLLQLPKYRFRRDEIDM